jgi:hypothetical protein
MHAWFMGVANAINEFLRGMYKNGFCSNLINFQEIVNIMIHLCIALRLTVIAVLISFCRRKGMEHVCKLLRFAPLEVTTGHFHFTLTSAFFLNCLYNATDVHHTLATRLPPKLFFSFFVSSSPCVELSTRCTS